MTRHVAQVRRLVNCDAGVVLIVGGALPGVNKCSQLYVRSAFHSLQQLVCGGRARISLMSHCSRFNCGRPLKTAQLRGLNDIPLRALRDSLQFVFAHHLAYSDN